tara:strand:- start:186 stop:491 length:306 start_codon:yes stop_codon:yes gene_type:complete
MQLFVITWSFSNGEDQLFATNEFCKYLNGGKFEKDIDGIDILSINHIPQEGTGVIICKANNLKDLYKKFHIWRCNFNISFSFKPALTNEDLLETLRNDNFH